MMLVLVAAGNCGDVSGSPLDCGPEFTSPDTPSVLSPAQVCTRIYTCTYRQNHMYGYVYLSIYMYYCLCTFILLCFVHTHMYMLYIVICHALMYYTRYLCVYLYAQVRMCSLQTHECVCMCSCTCRTSRYKRTSMCGYAHVHVCTATTPLCLCMCGCVPRSLIDCNVCRRIRATEQLTLSLTILHVTAICATVVRVILIQQAKNVLGVGASLNYNNLDGDINTVYTYTIMSPQ
jgi:hypothetical protein